MKKNILIFAVSIVSVLGVYSGARANIASTEYVTGQLADKLDNTPGVIEESHLIQDLKDKINNAVNGLKNKLDKTYAKTDQNKVLTVNEDGNVVASNIASTTLIDDKAIGLGKLDGGENSAVNRVLTVNDSGVVSAKLLTIPVGQTGTGEAAVWIEQ